MESKSKDERLEIKRNNIAAWNGESPFRVTSSLDSSLKKNTAFIKKARLALTAENLTSFKIDIENLSLEKYISEIVSAIAEGLGKVKSQTDVNAAIEIVSALHQRFTTQFTPFLAFHVVRGLAPVPASYLASLSAEQKEREETGRIARQRNLLRVAMELWMINVFRTIQDAIDGSGTEVKKRRMEEALPIFCLRELLSNDQDQSSLGIATTFVKNFAWVLTSGAEHEGMAVDDTSRVRTILEKYFVNLTAHLLKQKRVLTREETRLEDSTMTSGTISATREADLADLQRSHDKQVVAAQIIAEALGREMPQLDDEPERGLAESNMIRGFGSSKTNGEISATGDVWEDEDQRRFYEVLVDLDQVVPSDMLTEAKAGVQAASSTISSTSKVLTDPAQKPKDEGTEDDYDDADLDFDLTVEEEVEPPTAKIGAKVDALLSRLIDINNRELIDKVAIEFAFLNSKASRNRLNRTLLNVPNNRVDLLPYYARLIAILSRYLPSIGETVVAKLHRDCRRFVKNKGLNKDLPLRLNNIRYISELIKFRVVPTHVLFHCIRVMMDNFTKPDIEVLSSMLENCGRFLLKDEATSSKMQSTLEILMRKAKNISGVERSLIENAFYYVDPPEKSNIQNKERRPVDLYVDKLIYTDLSKRSYDKVLRQLKKLDWYRTDELKHLFGIFTKPWKIKFSYIHLLAILLSGLAKLHSQFAIRVIDTVLEEIKRGLEENKFRDNQKRIATMKYLGELLNHKLVEVNQIFDTLYILVSFGHPHGRPNCGGSQADPDEDYFRIRLALTILDTCGGIFEQGQYRQKLDIWLCFFQFYLNTKSTLPLDVEYAVKSSFSRLRPALKMCSTLEEAASELDEALKTSLDASYDTPEVDISTSSTTSPAGLSTLDDEETEADPSVVGEEQGTSDKADSGDEEEQQYVLLEKKRVQDDLDRLAEEELEREFGKMMNESWENRKVEYKKPVEIVLPRKLLNQSTSEPSPTPATNMSRDQSIGQAVSFTFLTKQGKPRSLNLPSNSALAIHNLAQKVAEQEEKRTIRDLTLKYEGAQSREDLDEDNAKKTAISVRYPSSMSSGQLGGTRSGTIFQMGVRPRPQPPSST